MDQEPRGITPENVNANIEITANQLVGMFATPKFQDALQTISSITQTEGVETAFDVELTERGAYMILEGLHRGHGSSMESPTPIRNMDRRTNEKYAKLLVLHFHPGANDLILPSDSDLIGQADRENRVGDVYWIPYIGIGQVHQNGDVKMLIVGAPRHPVPMFELEEFSETMVRTQAEGQVLLRDMGFENVLISMKKTPTGLKLSHPSIGSIQKTFGPIRARKW